MFQPRLILIVVAVGILTQSAALFLAMSLLLAWNALLPRLNPFDRLYPVLVSRAGATRPLVAPPPRRFAQGVAAAFMLGIGLLLRGGHTVSAWLLEGILAIALVALVWGKLCFGSYVYHVLRGTISRRRS
jgi:hypothetical protein